ncbi:MAG: hypothetical protein ABI672_11290 [Vicinamibacteria bacterium]
MIDRRVLVLLALVFATTVSAGAAESLPTGDYYCYTYNPKPLLVGVFSITGSSYHTRTGATGQYRMAGGRIDWLGTPPLGFKVGVLEETDPKAKVRMYPSMADLGNKWKAAVCTLRSDK